MGSRHRPAGRERRWRRGATLAFAAGTAATGTAAAWRPLTMTISAATQERAGGQADGHEAEGELGPDAHDEARPAARAERARRAPAGGRRPGS